MSSGSPAIQTFELVLTKKCYLNKLTFKKQINFSYVKGNLYNHEAHGWTFHKCLAGNLWCGWPFFIACLHIKRGNLGHGCNWQCNVDCNYEI